MTTHLKVRGRGLKVLALAATVGSIAGASSLAQADTGLPTTTAPTGATPPATAADAPAIAKIDRIVPRRRKVVHRRFRPWARPSPSRVRTIIRIEARRWHVSAAGLSRRVACESNYQWAAGNGAYQGLLQFASSTFYRGLSTIRSRSVSFTRSRTRWVREIKVLHYSDGRVVRKRGRRHRQRVVTVYRGTLPRRPGLTHGWTQLRIGAQAMRGMSAVHNSEWSCPA